MQHYKLNYKIPIINPRIQNSSQCTWGKRLWVYCDQGPVWRYCRNHKTAFAWVEFQYSPFLFDRNLTSGHLRLRDKLETKEATLSFLSNIGGIYDTLFYRLSARSGVLVGWKNKEHWTILERSIMARQFVLSVNVD